MTYSTKREVTLPEPFPFFFSPLALSDGALSAVRRKADLATLYDYDFGEPSSSAVGARGGGVGAVGAVSAAGGAGRPALTGMAGQAGPGGRSAFSAGSLASVASAASATAPTGSAASVTSAAPAASVVSTATSAGPGRSLLLSGQGQRARWRAEWSAKQKAARDAQVRAATSLTNDEVALMRWFEQFAALSDRSALFHIRPQADLIGQGAGQGGEAAHAGGASGAPGASGVSSASGAPSGTPQAPDPDLADFYTTCTRAELALAMSDGIAFALAVRLLETRQDTPRQPIPHSVPEALAFRPPPREDAAGRINHHPKNATEKFFNWQKAFQTLKRIPTFDMELLFAGHGLARGDDPDLLFAVLDALRAAVSELGWVFPQAQWDVAAGAPEWEPGSLVDPAVFQRRAEEGSFFARSLSGPNRAQGASQRSSRAAQERIRRRYGEHITQLSDLSRQRRQAEEPEYLRSARPPGKRASAASPAAALNRQRAALNNSQSEARSESCRSLARGERASSANYMASLQLDGSQWVQEAEERARSPTRGSSAPGSPLRRRLSGRGSRGPRSPGRPGSPGSPGNPGSGSSSVEDSDITVSSLQTRRAGSVSGGAQGGAVGRSATGAGARRAALQYDPDLSRQKALLYGIIATPKAGTDRQNYLLKLKGEVDGWLRSLACVPPTEIDVDTPLSDPYRNGLGMIQLYNEVFCGAKTRASGQGARVSAGSESTKILRPQSRAISVQVTSEYSRTLLAAETPMRPASPSPSSVADCKANLGRVVSKVLSRENVPEAIVPDAVEIARGNFVDTYLLLLVFYINHQALRLGAELSSIQDALVRHLEEDDLVLASLPQQQRTLSRGKEEVKRLDGIRLCEGGADGEAAAGGVSGADRADGPEGGPGDGSIYSGPATPRRSSRQRAPSAEPFDESEVMQFLFNIGVAAKPYATLEDVLPGLRTGVLLCAAVSAVFTAHVAPLAEDCRTLSHQTANVHRAFDYVRSHCKASLFCLRFMSQEANEVRIIRGEVQAAKDCLAELRGLYRALHPELDRLHHAAEVPSLAGAVSGATSVAGRAAAGKNEYISEGLVRPPAEMQATQCPPRSIQVFNGVLPMAELPFSVREDLVLPVPLEEGA